MPRRPPTRSPADTSATADRPAPARPHVVERALAVHRLRAAGQSAAEVQRRLRVSKSTVSVLGYLGAALAGMEPESVAQLRTPAVTARDVWRLATAARGGERAARAGAAADADREQARRRAIVGLRAALRDHLMQSRLTPATAGGRVRQTATRRVADRSAAARAVGWSHAAWADDPVAFAQAHLEALAAAHAHVAERAARAVALAGAEHALAGQVVAASEGSLHRLSGTRWRALAAAARSARTPAEERALAVLAVLTRMLREARDAVARLGAAPSTATASGSVADAGSPDQLDQVPWEDVEEDLQE